MLVGISGLGELGFEEIGGSRSGESWSLSFVVRRAWIVRLGFCWCFLRLKDRTEENTSCVNPDH